MSDERKEETYVWIDELLRSGVIHPSDASGLVGRTRWVLCPIFGRVGVACLQPLYDLRAAVRLDQDHALARCLIFLREAVRLVRPVVFPLHPMVAAKVVLVWTDASGKPCMGIVLYCPDDERWYYSYRMVPPWMAAWFSRLQRKKTYICQWEILAAVCAYLTFPDMLRGRLAHHFVDNQPALSGLIKGVDLQATTQGRLIHEYTLATVALACRPWLSFVYSEDNLSDGPSRRDLGLVQQLRADFRIMVIPRMVAWMQPSFLA